MPPGRAISARPGIPLLANTWVNSCLMNYSWDWGVLFREPYGEWLISGVGWTITVSLVAWFLAFTLGSVIGIMRTTDSKLMRGIATCYVEIFRNIPSAGADVSVVFRISGIVARGRGHVGEA